MNKKEAIDLLLNLYGDLTHYEIDLPTKDFISFEKEYYNNPIEESLNDSEMFYLFVKKFEEDLRSKFYKPSLDKFFEILKINKKSSTIEIIKILYENQDKLKNKKE